MAIIGGNWTNHPTRPQVEKSIREYATRLNIIGQLPNLAILDWNTLRRLETRLWAALFSQSNSGGTS